MGLIDLVLGYCRTIKNGRTIWRAYRSMIDEADELEAEIANSQTGEPAGPDGILGEAVDVIFCALDVIYLDNPNITPQQILEVAGAKCDKWRRVHGASPLTIWVR